MQHIRGPWLRGVGPMSPAGILRMSSLVVGLWAAIALALPALARADTSTSPSSTPSEATVTLTPGQTTTTTFTPTGCASSSCEVTVTAEESAVVIPSSSVSTTAASLSGSSLVATTSASLKKGETYRYTVKERECSVIACWIWHFGSTEQWYGKVGVKAWKDDINCADVGGTGYTINVTGCGFTNSPSYAPDPIDAHDDIEWHAVAHGIAISGSHAINYEDWSDGKVSVHYS